MLRTEKDIAQFLHKLEITGSQEFKQTNKQLHPIPPVSEYHLLPSEHLSLTGNEILFYLKT